MNIGVADYKNRREHPLPAKQAITVGSSSSGFKVTFLRDWSNFDPLMLNFL